MPEPRNDMFPDQSSKDQGVSEDVTTQVPTTPVIETPAVVATQESKPTGVHTPDNRLYAALQEERAKRQNLEARLEALESNSQVSFSSESTGEVYSDEGKLILQQIEPLKQKISSLEDELDMEKLVAKFPSLQGKKSEFDEYRKEFPSSKLENVAKLFLQENGLTEQQPIRSGLESPNSGPKIKDSSGSFSPEQVDLIRTTQPRLFAKMIREGTLTPEMIK